jgi:FKBP-type peptidyl-prolyl cis-trans isomerase FkpA
MNHSIPPETAPTSFVPEGSLRRRRRGVGVASFLLMAAALSGCLDPVEVEVPVDPPIEEVEFALSLGVDLDDFISLPSGVWVREDEVGEGGEAQFGQFVGVYFTGWAFNGNLFDRLEEGDAALPEFQLGDPAPLDALTLGIVGMRLGGTRTVLAPPSLGFGSATFIEGVPANSWLVLRIRLLRLDGLDA